MSREDSRRRAERARWLRGTGKTWQQIADSEGFRSRRAAQQAVARLAESEPADNPITARRTASDGLRITKSIMFAGMAEARQQGDHQAVVAYARAIADSIDKDAKINGLHAPVKSEVGVNVTTDPRAVIDRLESELLALVAQREPQAVIDSRPIIDAEVQELTR